MPVPSILIGLLLLASITAWASPGLAAGDTSDGSGPPAAVVEPDAAVSPAADDEAAEAGNPFAGRTITSAREALRILLDEMGFGSFVSYASIDEPGPEAVSLEGVVLEAPSDPPMRVKIGRIVLSELDLAGLGTVEGPARFSLALEAIDYADLAQGARAFAIPPLPEIEAGQTVTLAVSLLPVPGGEGRMAARLLVQIDQQLGLSFEVTAKSNDSDDALALMTFEEMPSDGFALELIDWGFLGTLLEAQAAEAGMAQDAFLAEGIETLRAGLQPMEPDSPSQALFAAVSAMLADLDHPGVLRVAVTTNRPRPLEALFNALAEAASLDDGDLRLAITYDRLP